jgi:hypothetical protein
MYYLQQYFFPSVTFKMYHIFHQKNVDMGLGIQLYLKNTIKLRRQSMLLTSRRSAFARNVEVFLVFSGS